MRRTTPLRNILAAATILAVFCSLLWWLPNVQAQGGLVVITPNPDVVPATAPGASITRTYSITNNDTNPRTFTLAPNTVTNPANVVTVSFPSSQIVVGAGGTTTFQVTYLFSPNAPPGSNIGFSTITATSNSPSSVSGQVVAQLSTSGTAPTNTSTPTLSATPTATAGPSPTPAPICQNGRESNDPGNDLGSAQLIRVNYQETHGLCTSSEEQGSPDVDWFYFGAGAGKVYTIDINKMSNGMDLQLSLFDANGVFLTGNDDFFQRADNNNNPSDLRPRIQSWRAPYDGVFYILVNDKPGSSGGDRTYDIEVRGESFGPTPTQISELCNDIYEQDGVPETAKQIFPNELQPQHVLCPTGDADWVVFYGAAGKSYFMFTDTRNYKNNPNFNPDTQSGADTIMYLFDRDGLTQLQVSDDIPNSLDSEIRFVPPVDGNYYVQIKNRGDLGSQFIRYDLTLKLCVSTVTECGRAEPVVPQSTPNPGGGSTPSPTTDTGFRTATPTGSTTPTQTRTPTVSPTQEPAFLEFLRVWQRADQPVATGNAPRSWLWGPKPLLRTNERYNEGANGERLVQYYDKARMEITNPVGKRSSSWFVTNGLLVSEMVRGQVQLGDAKFANRPAANIPVAGDQNDKVGPTYASLVRVVGKTSSDQTGEYATKWLSRNGGTYDYIGARDENAQMVQYIPQTGYNIPKVFWEYLNGRDVVYENGNFREGALMDWQSTLGLPIADPYWATVKVGGKYQTVLLQAFERRVLTYNPSNVEGWQVEMGNVGRHYYLWRYGKELPN